MTVHQEMAAGFKKFSEPFPKPNLSLTPHPKPRFTNWGTYTNGVDFLIWKGVFEVSNRREKLCLHIIHFKILVFIHMATSVNIFKIIYAYIDWYILLFPQFLLSSDILEVHVRITKCRRAIFGRECLRILVLNLNHGNWL